MTSIALLPQLTASFIVSTNGDWRDVIQFNQAGTTNPLDLTGLSFRAQLRDDAANPVVWLDMSTANGLLVNGGTTGQLSFAVPRDQGAGAGSTSRVPPNTYVMDIVASGDGQNVNLFQKGGPATVTFGQGVTR